jgi:lipopolysaccharide export system permease protein
MRTLDRYVTSEFLKYLTMAVVMFVALFVVVDLFEKMDKFIDHGAAAGDVILFYVYGVPYTLVLTVPIAMLLASLMVVGQLGRTGELVAMLSAGVGFLRIMAPVFGLALVIAGGTYLLAEHVMPETLERKEAIYAESIQGRDVRNVARQRKRDLTYVGRGDRLYYVKTVDVARGVLRDVVIQRFDEDRRLVERVDAREAVHVSSGWLFRHGVLRRGLPQEEIAVPFQNLWITGLPEGPEDFFSPEPDPMNMGRAELGEYIERLRASRARTRTFEVNYHLKIAYPLINVIIVILGSSLSVRIRRSGWALGLGLSMFIGFAYYAFIRFGQALGQSGALPPLLAAWIGNLVFLAVALGFQIRANR